MKSTSLFLALSAFSSSTVALMNGETIPQRRVGIATPDRTGDRNSNSYYPSSNNYDNNNNYNNNNNNGYSDYQGYGDYGYDNNARNPGTKINRRFGFDGFVDDTNRRNQYSTREQQQYNDYNYNDAYRSSTTTPKSAAMQLIERQNEERRRRKEERMRMNGGRDDYYDYYDTSSVDNSNRFGSNRGRSRSGGRNTIGNGRRRNDYFDMDGGDYNDRNRNNNGYRSNNDYNNDMQRPQRNWAAGERFPTDNRPPPVMDNDRRAYNNVMYPEQEGRYYDNRNDNVQQRAGTSNRAGEWWEDVNPVGRSTVRGSPMGGAMPFAGRNAGGRVNNYRRRQGPDDYYTNNNNNIDNNRYGRTYDVPPPPVGRPNDVIDYYRAPPTEAAFRPTMALRSAGTTPVRRGSYQAYEDRTTTIHGGSLHTFPLDEGVDRVQVFLQPEAPWMPVEASIELWQGPEFVEELAKVYVPEKDAPFSAIFDTQPTEFAGWTIVIRNTGPVEHPILASVESFR